jgi:hypothetical protein
MAKATLLEGVITEKQTSAIIKEIAKEEAKSIISRTMRPKIRAAIEKAAESHVNSVAFKKRLASEAKEYVRVSFAETPLRDLVEEGRLGETLWEVLGALIDSCGVELKPGAKKPKRKRRR